MANGPAAVSGLVNEGDLLITVNGGSIDGMTDREFHYFYVQTLWFCLSALENFSLPDGTKCPWLQI
jgi:hypothetical protein